MAAPKHNDFWKFRSKHGRDKLFESPELLWQEACKYFQWIKDNPLKETVLVSFRGSSIQEEVDRMRAMTISGLCFYLNCNEAYFRNFKNQNRVDGKDFSSVIEAIETVIYNQKFQGASADLLNANIISRELGLVDKKEVVNPGTGKPIHEWADGDKPKPKKKRDVPRLSTKFKKRKGVSKRGEAKAVAIPLSEAKKKRQSIKKKK